MKEEEKVIKIRYAFISASPTMRFDQHYHETLRFKVLTIAELELRPNRLDFKDNRYDI